MENIYRKNEFETNEIVSKAIRVLMLFYLITAVFCWLGIFSISNKIINGFLAVSAIPLLLPSLIVDVMRISKPWVKYILILCVIVVTGIGYTVFTFQVVILFMVPVILSVMYLDKKLFYFSQVCMCINILLVHFITVFHLYQPHIEPFTGMKRIMLYGAGPRILQFLCCSALLYILGSRYINFLNSYNQALEKRDEDNSKGNNQYVESKNKDELNEITADLTDREKEVFALLVQGYTNGQIAKELYLSMGTVKNYVSAIYDKTGIRDRTLLVLHYSRYYGDYDRSHKEILPR